MDVDSVLSHLARKDLSFPAMKLAWTCQLGDGGGDTTDFPKIPPSHYTSELQLSTLERRSLLCQQQRKLEFWGLGRLFSVVPTIIVFQQYKAGDSTQVVDVRIRNISGKPQKVQLRMEDTNVFELDSSSSRIAKFVSGMTISATIRFTPQDDGDHLHKLVVEAAECSFAIPILAIGRRAVLDIPDAIDFGRVPVKDLARLIQSVCNSGAKHAKFTLSAGGPFSASPEKCSLPPHDSFSIQLSCYAESVGLLEGFLCIRFDNGDQIHTTLSAECVEEDVRLSESRVQLPPTYIGMRSCTTTAARLTIINNSKRALQFSWKRDAARRHDARRESESDGRSTVFNTLRQTITEPSALHPADTQTSLTPAELLHVDPAPQLQHPEPLFHDKHFVLEPMTGLLQPHTTLDVQLFFSPTEPIAYEAVAYLDIAGRAQRLPLHVGGTGLGPKFQFGFDSLDIGEVYVGGRHSYEIPVTNTSEIRGCIHFESVAGLAGPAGAAGPLGALQVDPKRLQLAPDAYAAFYTSFTCTGGLRHVDGGFGSFVEELRFRVGTGSGATVATTGEVHSVLIRGRIALPQLSFSKQALELGDVAYGLPTTSTVVLHNDTLNYVSIRLAIDVDGSGTESEPALSCREILNALRLRDEDECGGAEEATLTPKEFSIHPTKFQMEPKGYQPISMTLLSNTYARYTRTLQVFIANDSDGDGGAAASEQQQHPVHSLPVSANCIVPALRIVNLNPDGSGVDDLGSVFAGFPSEGEFQIENESSTAGIYRIVMLPSDNGVLESSHLIGVLRQKSVTRIPYRITCPNVGDATVNAELFLAGIPEKILDLHTHALSCPCRLKANVKQVEFGTIPVLQQVEQSFELSNESPLPLSFRAEFVSRSSKLPGTHAGFGAFGAQWLVSPDSSTIEAFGVTTIKLGVRLIEAGEHRELLRIQTAGPDGTHVDIRVKACGVGTSLEVTNEHGAVVGADEQLLRVIDIDFGVMFVKTTKTLSYSIKNLGFFPRTLQWRPAKAPPPENAKTGTAGASARVVKSELAKYVREKGEAEARKKAAAAARKSNFQLTPTTTTFAPQESTVFHVKVAPSQHAAASLQEDFMLWVYTPYGQSQEDASASRSHNRNRCGGATATAAASPAELAHTPVVALRATLRANFELATLVIAGANANLNAEKRLSFDVDGNPGEDHWREEAATLRITNPGQLPIPAVFRTEFPFSIVDAHELQAVVDRGYAFDEQYAEGLFPEDQDEDEYKYERPHNNTSPGRMAVPASAAETRERLLSLSHTIAPSATLALTLHFAGRSLKTDRASLHFRSKLHVSIEGHPFTDFFQLDGTAHFPHIERCDGDANGGAGGVAEDNDEGVDFCSVPIGASAVKRIVLRNTCDYPIEFRWFVRPRTTWIRHGASVVAKAVAEVYEVEEEEEPAGGNHDHYQRQRDPTTRTRPTTPTPAGEQELGAAVVNPHCSELDKAADCVDSVEEEEEREDTSSEEQLGEENAVDEDATRPTPTASSSGIVQEPQPLPPPPVDFDKNESLLTFTDEEDEFIDFSDSEEPTPAVSMNRLNFLDASIQYVRDALAWKWCVQDFYANPPQPVLLQEAYPTRLPIVPDLLTVNPLYGVIEAGQQQEFSIAFCGQCELQLRTTLTCSLEGGAYFDLLVTSCSVLPAVEMLFPKPERQHQQAQGQALANTNASVKEKMKQSAGPEESKRTGGTKTKWTRKIPRPIMSIISKRQRSRVRVSCNH